jgi:Fe2+ transport system protein FeoA
MPALSPPSAQHLGETRPGSTVRVVRLEGQEPVCARLREMGFCEQAEVRVLNSGASVVCQVCGSRVGLSRGLAASIVVSAAERR